MKTVYPLSELTGKIISCAMELLINFGNTSLHFKRVMKLNKNHSQSKNH